MRLIDADKLMLSLADWELQEAPIHTYEKPKEFTADDMQRMIWRTIRDCESAVEEQPTVKTIPIEWLMKKADEWATKDITYDGKPFTAQQVGLAIASMVIDWEKENEHKESD